MPRWILLSAGWLMVIVGVIGVFVPLLPTTPFLLVAVYCFSASSPRFHDWLIHHPQLGPPIVAWRNHGVIRLQQKWMATAAIAATFTISILVVKDKPIALYGMAGTLCLALLFIWTRPSRPRT